MCSHTVRYVRISERALNSICRMKKKLSVYGPYWSGGVMAKLIIILAFKCPTAGHRSSIIMKGLGP